MLKKALPVKIGVFGAVFPPFICACGCGTAAFFMYRLLDNNVNPTFNVIISTISGAFIYAILLILTGCFRTSGIRKAKITKKSKKTLAK